VPCSIGLAEATSDAVSQSAPNQVADFNEDIIGPALIEIAALAVIQSRTNAGRKTASPLMAPLRAGVTKLERTTE
jgi:hypothetical protein